MAGQRQRAPTLHPGRLDEQHFAARRGPGEADSDAGILGAVFDLLVEERRGAEHLDDRLTRDDDLALFPLGAPPRHLAAERADFALEITHAPLARIPPHP